MNTTNYKPVRPDEFCKVLDALGIKWTEKGGIPAGWLRVEGVYHNEDLRTIDRLIMARVRHEQYEERMDKAERC